MRRAAAVLLGLALAAMAFGSWGLNTGAGRAMFDEMARIIPLAALVVGGAAALVALLMVWRSTRR